MISEPSIKKLDSIYWKKIFVFIDINWRYLKTYFLIGIINSDSIINSVGNF